MTLKTLNFTAKEVLPSLLNKSKVQTIRPAWKTEMVPDEKSDGTLMEEERIVNKPPKFKVGEEVELVWNKDSKYDIFCELCGNGMKEKEFTGGLNYPFCKKCDHFSDSVCFNKILGKAKITKVFKIEIFKPERSTTYYRVIGEDKLFDIIFNDIAKKDGFKSREEMFNYLDKKYGLDKPKEFWVYRYKWLK